MKTSQKERPTAPSRTFTCTIMYHNYILTASQRVQGKDQLLQVRGTCITMTHGITTSPRISPTAPSIGNMPHIPQNALPLHAKRRHILYTHGITTSPRTSPTAPSKRNMPHIPQHNLFCLSVARAELLSEICRLIKTWLTSCV